MTKIAVFGAGTWGIALARLLAVNGRDVTVWSAIPAELKSLSTTRRHPNLPGLVSRILAEEGVLPDCLELELTEGVASNDPERAIAIMADLRARGVRMSIDDFGTGYSSLSYLKRFKVYKLKIDKSFVRDISRDPEDEAIVAAIIGLAESLGMQTIAEGVETSDQMRLLTEIGCDQAQGYLFGRPVPPEEFERRFLK